MNLGDPSPPPKYIHDASQYCKPHKLTPETVIEILTSDEPVKALAKKYGSSGYTIWRIKAGRGWEIWRRIIFKGRRLNYEVSTLGRVRHALTKQLTRVHRNIRSGRQFVNLSLSAGERGRGKAGIASIRVTVLVGEAFLRQKQPGEQYDHRNEINHDDRLANLRIISSCSANIRKSYQHGRRKKATTGRKDLTDADHNLIDSLWKQGYSQVRIGQALGLSNGCISRIVNNLSQPRVWSGIQTVTLDEEILNYTWVPTFTHKRTKISDEQFVEVAKARGQISAKDVAAKYGLSPLYVYSVWAKKCPRNRRLGC